MSKFPESISKKSSKKQMLKEIRSLQAEVDSQQCFLNSLREQNQQLSSQLNFYTHQVSLVKHALSLEINLGGE